MPHCERCKVCTCHSQTLGSIKLDAEIIEIFSHRNVFIFFPRVCALVHMQVCACTYMTARGDDVRILSFNLFSILFSLRQALSLACWSPFWLD